MKVKIGPYKDGDKPRKIEVKIHKYDTWGMDETLAYIIVPMLKQLKETTHGAPFVDDEDVPEEIRSTNAPPKKNEYDTDDHHFSRWDYVLDEMIWAFEQKLRFWEDDYISQYGEIDFGDDVAPDSDEFIELEWKTPMVCDREGMKRHQERMTNGFRLFGKYYEGLWD